MPILSIIFFSLLTSISAALAIGDQPTKVDVTRDGKNTKQIMIKQWQGEAPAPMIDIHSKEIGTTTIQGWTSFQSLDQKQACTIKNGLYHPWSNTENSVIDFFTLAGVEDYTVTQDVPVEVYRAFFIFEDAVPPIKKGDKIVNSIYLAEGISLGILVQGEQQTLVHFQARVFKENPLYFTLIEKTANLVETTDPVSTNTYMIPEQWLLLECQEGHTVYIRDTELLSQSGILEGTVTGFGDIVPAH
jgi:hypothetical protein